MEHYMVYDEWLKERKNLEYGEIDEFTLSIEDIIKKREEEVFNTILLCSGDGISHKDLTIAMKMHRTTLRRYTKKLIQKKLITRDGGKHGKYYPLTKNKIGGGLTANILSDYFISNILEDDEFAMELTDDISLEESLFNFSNKVGGFITHTLIQLMNPPSEIAIMGKNEKERELHAKAWFEDVIESILPHLYRNFMRAIFPITSLKNVNQMNRAFSNLYPKLYYELQKVKSELPILVDQALSHKQYIVMKRKIQEKCEHEHITPIRYMPHSRSPMHLSHLLHCSKCHKTVSKYG